MSPSILVNSFSLLPPDFPSDCWLWTNGYFIWKYLLISWSYILSIYFCTLSPLDWTCGTGDLSFHVYEAEFVCTKCCCGLLLANEYMIQVRNLGSSDLEIVGVVEVAFFPSWCWWLISMELWVTLSYLTYLKCLIGRCIFGARVFPRDWGTVVLCPVTCFTALDLCLIYALTLYVLFWIIVWHSKFVFSMYF